MELTRNNCPSFKILFFIWISLNQKGFFVLSFHEQKPFLVSDMDEIKDNISEKSLEFLKETGSKAFVCCPIIYEKTLGVLVVDNIGKKRELTQTDISILLGIAPDWNQYQQCPVDRATKNPI